MNKSNRVSLVLLDLDGVIEGPNEVDPDAVKLCLGLHDRNLPFAIVTNDIRPECYSRSQALAKVGLSIDTNHWITPYDSLLREMKHLGLAKPLLVGSSPPKEFSHIFVEIDAADCVVLSDLSDDYDRYAQISKEVYRNNMPLFCLQRNQYLLTAQDRVRDVGYFIDALEADLGLKCTLLGKPAPNIYMEALQRFNVSAEQTLFVSDSYSNDLRGAVDLDLRTVLVKRYAFPEEVIIAKNADCIVVETADEVLGFLT